MDAYTIVKILIAVASFCIATLIPSIIMLVKKWKAWKQAKEEAAAAKTEAEKAAAVAEEAKVKNELLELANTLVGDIETAYKQFDTIIKEKTGKGVGVMKKESVMTKLQAACIEKGVPFDSDFWSNKIDEIVKLTRTVNTNVKDSGKENVLVNLINAQKGV